jgi:ribonuclease-3
VFGFFFTSQKNTNKEFYLFLKSILGFKPKDIEYYKIAFTHKSAPKHTNTKQLNNERLEFLGDSILDSIIAEYLFHKYPNKDEGFLTTTRSKIVNRAFLDELAEKLQLNEYIVSNISSSSTKHHYGNAFEALIGAIYLDRGYKKTKHFIEKRIIERNVDFNTVVLKDNNFKSRLIEWCQKNKHTFRFETKEEQVNQEDINFVSYVFINNKLTGTGFGFTKKEAEQQASKNAISDIAQ